MEKEDAYKDYEKFYNLDCDDISFEKRNLLGSKFLDYYFFEERSQTLSRKGINFIDFYRQMEKTKDLPKSLITFFEWNEKNSNRNFESIMYDYFRLYYGSINQFRPSWAKKIYCIYQPKSILDISAGWGGRLLGAIAMGIPYIGFDTNINLKDSYDEIIELLKPKKTKIIFKDSSTVDYSKYDYDMVFTSPPYYTTETYSNMPEYKSKEDFNEKFLFPTVEKSYKYLKKSGHYILNIPIEIYNSLIPILGKANESIPLNLTVRDPKKKVNKDEYKEYIYVWKKK